MKKTMNNRENRRSEAGHILSGPNACKQFGEFWCQSDMIGIDVLHPAESVLKSFNDALRAQIARIDNAVISNPVIAFQALFSTVHNTIVMQQGKMFRNVCLSGIDLIDNLLNCMLPFTENAQYFQSHRLRKQLESIGNSFKHFIRHIEIPLFYFLFSDGNGFFHDNLVAAPNRQNPFCSCNFSFEIDCLYSY